MFHRDTTICFAHFPWIISDRVAVSQLYLGPAQNPVSAPQGRWLSVPVIFVHRGNVKTSLTPGTACTATLRPPASPTGIFGQGNDTAEFQQLVPLQLIPKRDFLEDIRCPSSGKGEAACQLCTSVPTKPSTISGLVWRQHHTPGRLFTLLGPREGKLPDAAHNHSSGLPTSPEGWRQRLTVRGGWGKASSPK